MTEQKTYWVIKDCNGLYYCQGFKYKIDINIAFVYRTERAAKIGCSYQDKKRKAKPIRVTRTTKEI